ncbi:hypothetical protein TSUD_400870 [Trifolium subterraneum]|uniref:Uncharacterized protein n=1 Tax=Trifolium subterraneum TaxID=3900 RepID=A0A2Z6P8C3_TRISU|nr:hypothetical protein TSUD_400870 [Trifolium subterraneum]
MDLIDKNQEEDHPIAMEDSDNTIDDVEDDGENEENASENEEEVEEKEDTVNEDEFMFREGTNPLDLLHDNDFGVQMCQRLQDYKALPNKKRKTPEQCHRQKQKFSSFTKPPDNLLCQVQVV